MQDTRPDRQKAKAWEMERRSCKTVDQPLIHLHNSGFMGVGISGGTFGVPKSNEKIDQAKAAKRKLEDIENESNEDETGSDENENVSNVPASCNNDPASCNNDPEELEDDENIEIDLKSVADELRRAPTVEWNVGAVNVTERFRLYQREVLQKAKKEGLTYNSIYEVLALSSIIVLCWPCPYPMFTNQEWLEISKTNPYTINEPPLLPEISHHLWDAARKHLAGKDALLDGEESGLSRTIACLFNQL
ncbi:hypothetical protein BC936DRAFT_142159 [Jimgerdemannia flammicorona]|nr:hypothetical protein BC936DRAFT_142159 [Jimgerdemannia flammicorona]